MPITISRHAKRRIALYEIDPGDILAIIKRYMKEKHTSEGKHIVVDQNAVGKYGFPLKIAFTIEGSKITVITAYPLKKGVNK